LIQYAATPVIIFGKILMLKVTHVQRFKTGLCKTCRSIIMTSVATAGLLAGSFSVANDAAITAVDIKSVGDGMYQVSVTLEHADTGWDHYANRWDVLDQDGNVLGSRVLAHPHVNEQPFTRSLRVAIPESVKVVTIVASDSVHGDNEETVQVEVPE